MLDVLITGHATGFGKYLSEYLKDQGFSVTGVSRRTGHDIHADRDKIVQLSLDHKVVINNAWCPYEPTAQSLLLHYIHSEWVSEDKSGTIISIGSRAAVEQKETESMPDRDLAMGYLVYAAAKKGLLSKNAELAKQRIDGIQVCCLNFGYLDTDQFKDKRVKIPLRNAVKVVEMVMRFAVSSPPIQIRDMTVEATRE